MSLNQPSPASPNGPRHPNPDDLVLYAMQLLPDQEAAAVTRHLEQCAECHAEFACINRDLVTLAATVDLHSPPDASRQRLVQQVAREKKIVSIAKAQPQTPAQTQPALPIAAFGRSASILSIEDRQPTRSAGPAILAVVGWAVAACLAVALALQYKGRDDLQTTAHFQALLVQRLNTEAASSRQLMDALTDPKAIRVTLTTKPQPKAAPIGGVTYNPEKGALVFLASNLDPLQAYKTYELWVIPADGTAPIPAGTFHPDDQGNANVIMPDLPKGVAAKAFGVTIETEGGAPTPTPPIIMSGS
jgi:anti-sigma-K factor RskA